MTPYYHLEHRSLVAQAALAKVRELLASGGGDALGAQLALWHIQDAVDAAYWAGSSDGIDRMMDSLTRTRVASIAQGS
jgi:hypothetical protein